MKIYNVLLLIVSVINILPIIGFFASAQLSRSYGIYIDEPNIELLLRHRALLFGLLGGLLFYSIFQPAMQTVATTLVMVSMLTFVALVVLSSETNSALMKIAYIDLFAIGLLAFAIFVRVNKGSYW